MDEKLKVLVVVYNKGQIKLLRKYFQDLEGTIEVSFAKTAEDALNTIHVEDRDVVIVDENLPDISGIKFTELVRQDTPTTQVVLISQNKHVDTVLRAVRAGAFDFITYDVTFEEFSTVVRRAGEQAAIERKKTYSFGGEAKREERPKAPQEHVPGNVVAVYSPKGGTGVSTITANLALSLRDKDYDIALIDANLQYGDIALLFNEISRISVLNLAPRVDDLDTKLIEDVMIHHKSSGVFIMPAPARLDLSEQMSGDQFIRIIEYMRDMYRYIVINTQPLLNETTLAALDAADIVVLVLTQEITAIKAARMFLDLWEGLKLNKERILVVLNHFDKDSSLTPKKVSESLKVPVTITIPEDKQALVKAANLGTPIVLSERHSQVTYSIVQIADAIHKRLVDIQGVNRAHIFVEQA